MSEAIQSEALTREQVAAIDWSRELQPATHPIPLGLRGDTVVDLRTGAVAATAAPGYRLYWRHGHVHLAPADWPVGERLP